MREMPVTFTRLSAPALCFAAALGLAVFAAAPKDAAAYDGLLSGSSTSDGYDGLLAPAQPSGRGSRGGTQEPPGYEGLMRGTVPQRPVETPDADDNDAAPRAAGTRPPAAGNNTAGRPATGRPAQTARPELAMTPRPGRIRPGPVNSVEQLQMIAALAGTRLDLTKLADGVKPSPELFGMPYPKQPRINGMTATELLAHNEVQKVMNSINNPRLSDTQRQQNARAGYERLKLLADGVMTRRAMPPALFKKMGASDEFIAEEKEANERALSRYEEAFKALRPLQ